MLSFTFFSRGFLEKMTPDNYIGGHMDKQNEDTQTEREHLIEKYIINTLQENSCKEKILTNLHNIFDLNPEQAEEYFEKYAYATK